MRETDREKRDTLIETIGDFFCCFFVRYIFFFFRFEILRDIFFLLLFTQRKKNKNVEKRSNVEKSTIHTHLLLKHGGRRIYWYPYHYRSEP